MSKQRAEWMYTFVLNIWCRDDDWIQSQRRTCALIWLYFLYIRSTLHCGNMFGIREHNKRCVNFFFVHWFAIHFASNRVNCQFCFHQHSLQCLHQKGRNLPRKSQIYKRKSIRSFQRLPCFCVLIRLAVEKPTSRIEEIQCIRFGFHFIHFSCNHNTGDSENQAQCIVNKP